MGFSTSGAVAILFVGALIALGIAYPAVQGAHDQRSQAIQDRDDRALDVRNTAIDLENATYDSTADELVVNLTNTGSTTIDVNDTDLLVDGIYQTDVNSTVVGIDGDRWDDRELWQPAEHLELSVSPTDDGHPDRIKVVTDNGVAETGTAIEEVS